jgi:small subunit ribosomal protein S20
MPIIKSSIKSMKQSLTRRAGNRHYGNHMKSMIKLILGYIENGEMDKAKKLLPEVISAIDTAAKKKIIEKNNASNKKSRIQRALNAGPAKKEEKAVKAKADQEVKKEKLEKAENAKKAEKAERVEKAAKKEAVKAEKKVAKKTAKADKPAKKPAR